MIFKLSLCLLNELAGAWATQLLSKKCLNTASRRQLCTRIDDQNLYFNFFVPGANVVLHARLSGQSLKYINTVLLTLKKL